MINSLWRWFSHRLHRRYHLALDRGVHALKNGERGPNQLGKEGHSLLHLSLILDQKEVVEELLKSKASPEIKNKWGMTPAKLGELLGRKSCLSLLKKKEEIPLLIYRNKDQTMASMAVESFEKKMEIEYIDELIFEHAAQLNAVAKKCRKWLKKPHFRQMNRWVLALCGKRLSEEMVSIRRDHFYVRWINAYLGYGVFAAKDLPALTYIGQYTGEIRRRRFCKKRSNDYVFIYTAGPKKTPFIIDAKKKGNFSRFINHSNRPNLTSRWVVINGITRIILFSNQFITKGKQLTYDYGPFYWKSRLEPELI